MCNDGLVDQSTCHYLPIHSIICSCPFICLLNAVDYVPVHVADFVWAQAVHCEVQNQVSRIPRTAGRVEEQTKRVRTPVLLPTLVTLVKACVFL